MCVCVGVYTCVLTLVIFTRFTLIAYCVLFYCTLMSLKVFCRLGEVTVVHVRLWSMPSIAASTARTFTIERQVKRLNFFGSNASLLVLC